MMASSIEAQIQATCSTLLEIALNTMVGAVEVPISPARARDKSVNEMLQWRRHELRLRAEVSDYKAALRRLFNEPEDMIMDAAESAGEVINQLDEQLNKGVVKLQDELFERSSKYQRDQLLIRRVIQVPLLLHAITAKTQTEDNKYTKDEAKSRDRAVIQILKNLQKLKVMRSSVEEAKQKSLDVQVQNGKLYLELQDRCGKSRQVPTGSQEVHDELGVVTSRTSILHHVLRSLILESGVNWAQRQDLRKFVLQEGR